MPFKEGDRLCWIDRSDGSVIHGSGWVIVKHVREDGWVHLGSQYVPEGVRGRFYYDPSRMRLCDENLKLI